MSNVIVLPVGHLLGPFFTNADDEVPESVDLRVGGELSSLPPEAYLVWAAAHGDPQQVATAPMTKAATLERAGVVLDQPGRAYRELVSRGLLVEVGAGKRGQREFAERHRVLPLVMGLGNSFQRPEEFVIGMVGSPVMTLPGSVFSVWMFGHQYPTLWQTCENVAMSAAATLGGQSVGPARVLADVVALLPLLVSTGCGCVDRRSDV
ncbi:MAG: hypothetical protein ACRDPW_07965 [Mycobacteriales bacterium]